MKKVLIGGIVAVIVGVVVIGFLLLRTDPIVPIDIQNKVNFPIFYPETSSQVTIQKTTFKYDSSLQQVSFIVNFSNQQLTFAEQSSPDSFAVDPNFYPAFIQKLNGYDTFGSVNGRVDLTRPAQVNAETGIMNAKGTLLFIKSKSNGNLNESAWKLLFNSLNYTQPH